MEQTRIVVAVVLSFLVLLIYQMFFVEKKTDVLETVQNEAVQEQKAIPATIETDERVFPDTGTESNALENRLPEMITIDTPLYQVRISEAGAAFKSFKLKDYRETVAEDSDLKELIDPENPTGTMISGFNGNSVQNLADGIYTCQAASKQMVVQNSPQTVSFIMTSDENVVIKKDFVFSPETYLIDIYITVENRSGKNISDKMTLSMMDSTSGNTTRLGFSGPSAMVDDEVEELKVKKISGKESFKGSIKWAAFQDRYFMNTIIPSNNENTTVEFEKIGDGFLETRVMLQETTIVPNSQQQFNFQAYLGPKNITILKSLGHRLERVVDFGWFDWFARPCLWVMNLIYRFVPNYGVAIILLTLIIKGILWPLGNKSYKSMGQMKRMQPIMAELREKYKDDKQKMNMEMMALYKTYKVNPLGGCLPMFVQLPVLYGLYRMLYQAVELRHEPFIWWIRDLSAPERLFNFNVSFSLPIMQPPYGIPVLTILMGLSMFIQQKMQPPMGDQAQAKMMMFMPLMFVFICINISSGLVLYWLVSQIISILQQYYVTKKTI
jgi:YidC/Oxa1 family membrane protein insertase